ncbi:MAG: glycosyltransferase [Candidatus Bathyarchaeia archaeon]
MFEGISAVVATLNCERTIGKCIESILMNGLGEIVLVDGGSKDDTLRIAGRYPFVKIVRDIKGGIAHHKDAGWRKARGLLILFIDADTYIEDGTVQKLIPHLDDESVAGVSCRVSCANPHKFWAEMRDLDFKIFYSRLFKDSRVVRCPADPTVCGLFKRKALEDIDGFDLTYSYAEDLKLITKLERIGYWVKMVYDPAVYHYHRESLRDVCKQFYRHGYGRGLFVGETRGRFYLRRNPIQLLLSFLEIVAEHRSPTLMVYPIYRLFTEASFLLGYVLGRLSRGIVDAPVRRVIGSPPSPRRVAGYAASV